jgi:hypothetical protein
MLSVIARAPDLDQRIPMKMARAFEWKEPLESRGWNRPNVACVRMDWFSIHRHGQLVRARRMFTQYGPRARCMTTFNAWGERGMRGKQSVGHSEQGSSRCTKPQFCWVAELLSPPSRPT